MAHVTFILGGARSGKSARALALADSAGGAGAGRKLFVATAEPLDAEMADRIRLHQAERGPDWRLAEAPLDVAAALAGMGPGDVALIDCLTLWLSNLMHHGRDVAAETAALIAALREAEGRALLVSNEIGLGLSPMEALSRAFRDEQGRLNQRIAAAADRVEFVAAGLPLVLKEG